MCKDGVYLKATMVFATVMVVIKTAFRIAGVQMLPVFLYRLREMIAAMDRVGTIATIIMPDSAEPSLTATPVANRLPY